MLEQIRDIFLKHKGRKNSITSAEIAHMLGIHEDSTYSITRAFVFYCAKKYKLPIAGDSRGYYLIDNHKEYISYIENLDSRIAGIEDRKRIITQNYKHFI